MPCASIMAASAGTVPPPERSALLQRLAAAAVLMPLTVGLAWAGGALWALAITALAVVALWEWQRMICPDAWITTIVAALIAAGGCMALFVDGPGTALLVVGTGAVASVATTIRNIGFGRALLLAAGVIYIGLGLLGLVLLREIFSAGFAAILWLLVCVWASDSGAYAAGKLIGGPRLAPLVSPNKTWAGLAGAMLAPAVIGLMFGVFWPGSPAPVLLAGLGFVIGLVGQAGDLVESAAKRHAGVKDSGRLIPGHGGVLDRIDALLAASLFVAGLYLMQSGGLSWS
jgi:phosphatidate cytidylyltransferase